MRQKPAVSRINLTSDNSERKDTQPNNQSSNLYTYQQGPSPYLLRQNYFQSQLPNNNIQYVSPVYPTPSSTQQATIAFGSQINRNPSPQRNQLFGQQQYTPYQPLLQKQQLINQSQSQQPQQIIQQTQYSSPVRPFSINNLQTVQSYQSQPSTIVYSQVVPSSSTQQHVLPTYQSSISDQQRSSSNSKINSVKVNKIQISDFQQQQQLPQYPLSYSMNLSQQQQYAYSPQQAYMQRPNIVLQSPYLIQQQNQFSLPNQQSVIGTSQNTDKKLAPYQDNTGVLRQQVQQSNQPKFTQIPSTPDTSQRTKMMLMREQVGFSPNVKNLVPGKDSPSKITISYSPSKATMAAYDLELFEQQRALDKKNEQDQQSIRVLRDALDFIQRKNEMPEPDVNLNYLSKFN